MIQVVRARNPTLFAVPNRAKCLARLRARRPVLDPPFADRQCLGSFGVLQPLTLWSRHKGQKTVFGTFLIRCEYIAFVPTESNCKRPCFLEEFSSNGKSSSGTLERCHRRGEQREPSGLARYARRGPRPRTEFSPPAHSFLGSRLAETAGRGAAEAVPAQTRRAGAPNTETKQGRVSDFKFAHTPQKGPSQGRFAETVKPLGEKAYEVPSFDNCTHCDPCKREKGHQSG